MSELEEDIRSGRPSLRELEVLRAMIASRKTIAAAHLLGVSQPAVSRAIASLEARTGRQLFSREGGRLTPTADAFALESEAGAIFDALDRLSQWPDRRKGRAVVRIASAPTHAHYLLPRYIAKMRRIDPEVTFAVEVCTGTEVLAQVADRRVELGLLDMPTDHPAVRSELIREVEVHALVPEDHPLAQLKVITAPDLAGVPLIVASQRFTSRAELDKGFQRAGIRPNIVAEVSVTSLSMQLVRQGLGISIFSPFPVSLDPAPGTVWRPYRPTIWFRTCLLFPSTGGVHPAARRFADLMADDVIEDGISRPVRAPRARTTL